MCVRSCVCVCVDSSFGASLPTLQRLRFTPFLLKGWVEYAGSRFKSLFVELAVRASELSLFVQAAGLPDRSQARILIDCCSGFSDKAEFRDARLGMELHVSALQFWPFSNVFATETATAMPTQCAEETIDSGSLCRPPINWLSNLSGYYSAL